MEVSEDLTFSRNVCQIFKEVTGLTADPERESFVIQYWVKRGWSAYEFRLMIDFEYHDAEQKDFYSKPGMLNLRMMLNPNREARLQDVLLDLKSREARKVQREEKAKLIPRILMKCGERVRREDYETHLIDCFEKKGSCFFRVAVSQ